MCNLKHFVKEKEEACSEASSGTGDDTTVEASSGARGGSGNDIAADARSGTRSGSGNYTTAAPLKCSHSLLPRWILVNVKTSTGKIRSV